MKNEVLTFKPWKSTAMKISILLLRFLTLVRVLLKNVPAVYLIKKNKNKKEIILTFVLLFVDMSKMVVESVK